MNPYEYLSDNFVRKQVVVKTSVELQEGLGDSINGILKNWTKDFIHLEYTDPKSLFKEGITSLKIVEGIFEPNE